MTMLMTLIVSLVLPLAVLPFSDETDICMLNSGCNTAEELEDEA